MPIARPRFPSQTGAVRVRCVISDIFVYILIIECQSHASFSFTDRCGARTLLTRHSTDASDVISGIFVHILIITCQSHAPFSFTDQCGARTLLARRAPRPGAPDSGRRAFRPGKKLPPPPLLLLLLLLLGFNPTPTPNLTLRPL